MGTESDTKANDKGDKGDAGGSGGDADQKLADMVNAAVGGHLKRVLSKAIAESIGAALKPIEDRIASLAPPDPKGGSGGKKGDAGGDGGGDDPRVAELAKRHEQLAKKLEESEAKRLASERAAADERTKGDLRKALGEAKIRPEMVEMAVRLLRADGRVKSNDAGESIFVDGDEEMKLGDGLKKWLKTPEGQTFVPAPSAQNGPKAKAGSFAPRKGGDGKEIAEKSDAKAARLLAKQGIGL